ncbi:unnamed protein product [Danaus chrysippus]|uniref:(African queen) hypothetical protein n=1 Tax=Danaus chrysippus TaxID=151541 RepID=A0A8J2W0W9_9NEOP|nr:unnamed protein product [Danaus chrysippus]
MDEYGGPAPPRPPKTSGARVHRPAGPGRAAPVSLLRPRPQAEREPNAYVEAPRRALAPPAPRAPPAQPLKPVTSQPAVGAESILCAGCGRCRCEQCARPRPLPSRWLCGSCLCSAEACVDYASCMCCAKALFYHCGSGEEEAAGACGPRLAVLAALAVPLPCLCLYWPLRALSSLCASLYARARRPGCRCAPPSSSSII